MIVRVRVDIGLLRLPLGVVALPKTETALPAVAEQEIWSPTNGAAGLGRAGADRYATGHRITLLRCLAMARLDRRLTHAYGEHRCLRGPPHGPSPEHLATEHGRAVTYPDMPTLSSPANPELTE